MKVSIHFHTSILPYFHTCIYVLCGSSSVGRATAFQAVGRGFEPRLPLLVAGASAQATFSHLSPGEGGSQQK
jgi:hypothetical protein